MTARQIKRLRKRLKLSQAGLAVRLQCSIDTVRNWEQGRTVPLPSFQSQLQLLREEARGDGS